MNYCELSFSCAAQQPSEIVFDLLASSLCEIGFDSFERKNDILLGYIPAERFDRLAVQNCIVQLPLEGVKIQYTESSLVVSRKMETGPWRSTVFRIGRRSS